MSVSRLERSEAMLMAHEVDSYVDRASAETARWSLRIFEVVRKAFIKGRDVTAAFHAEFEKIAPQIANTMLVGALLGVYRAAYKATTQNWMMSSGLWENTIDKHQLLMQIPHETLNTMQEQLGTQALTAVHGASAHIEKRLQRKVGVILQEGMHVREGVKELGKEFASLGIVPKHKNTLETLYRTQTQMAYGAGRSAQLMDPDIDEILWGYKYVTVGDDRVRAEHAGLEGVTLPKDHPFWVENTPINGYNCRCQAIPLYDPPEGGVVNPPTRFEGITPGADKGFRFHPKALFDICPMAAPGPKKVKAVPKKAKGIPKWRRGGETFAEVEKEFSKATGIRSSYVAGELKGQAVVRILESIGDDVVRMRASYPAVDVIAVQKPLGSLTLVAESSVTTGASAQYAWNGNTLQLSVKGRQALSKLKLGQFTAGRDYTTLFRHEYAHHIHRNALHIGKQLREVFESQSKSYWKKRVSHYATTNPSELFAESFAIYTHPEYALKPGARLPKVIEDFFEKVLGAKNPNLVPKIPTLKVPKKAKAVTKVKKVKKVEKVTELKGPTVRNTIDLPDDELDAFSTYVVDSKRLLNVQRGLTQGMDQNTIKSAEKVLGHMRDGYQRVEQKYTGTLYRGISVSDDTAKKWMTPGHIIEQEAWTSTSSEVSVAKATAKETPGDAKLVLKIKVRRTGVDLSEVNFEYDESEYILPKGFKWKIQRVERKGGFITVHGEQVS